MAKKIDFLNSIKEMNPEALTARIKEDEMRLGVLQKEHGILKEEVTEEDIALVKVGQTAIVSLDSIPGQVFTGQVTQVDTVGKRLELLREVRTRGAPIARTRRPMCWTPGAPAAPGIATRAPAPATAAPGAPRRILTRCRRRKAASAKLRSRPTCPGTFHATRKVARGVPLPPCPVHRWWRGC